ncbi:sterol desaturase family protein [Alicyclobacillus tolerans]|uniref:Fatty acid hydroxylase domain-containing protein n=2 Tax=Alicyclobacillus tolerans TaxID=90970 RepID=A0ABT9LVP1_9BACL|nr:MULTISPECIES: sterol desaturase family protein [Alicyclobacillus]MDP9728256.1 hypothetical protein [Alicyclobacillus tengchongensis]SHJ81084.1 Fatty acid hydroxylase superfamily protein [Alicyclobacillus montanus]
MREYLLEFWTDRRVMFLSLVFIASIILTFSLHHSLKLWIAFLSGAVAWYFIEYIVHRFILHGILSKIMPRAYEGHVRHHTHPEEMKTLLTPNQYNIPGYLGIFLLCIWISHSLDISFAFLTTLSICQLYYEWSHFVSHRPIVPLTPWGKWMKKFHLLHHFQNEHYWFGVTNSTLDALVGTSPDPKIVERVSSADKNRYRYRDKKKNVPIENQDGYTAQSSEAPSNL